MRNKVLLIILNLLLIFPNAALANRTESQYFTANCPVLRRIIPISNALSTTIDPWSGALNSSLIPRFSIITNSREQLDLTMSAIANVQGQSANALFSTGNTKYIILTNNSKLPALNSINNIKGLTPKASDNPNAIAYRIDDPHSSDNALKVDYNSANNYWDLKLTKRGMVQTSVTIPAQMPLNNTYSFSDEPGVYQATVILSFN